LVADGVAWRVAFKTGMIENDQNVHTNQFID